MEALSVRRLLAVAVAYVVGVWLPAPVEEARWGGMADAGEAVVGKGWLKWITWEPEWWEWWWLCVGVG